VRDFHVLFLSDGTTTFGMSNASAAELQKATLATLGSLFAQVLTVGEMCRRSGVLRALLRPESIQVNTCALSSVHRSYVGVFLALPSPKE